MALNVFSTQTIMCPAEMQNFLLLAHSTFHPPGGSAPLSVRTALFGLWLHGLCVSAGSGLAAWGSGAWKSQNAAAVNCWGWAMRENSARADVSPQGRV